MKYKVGQRVKIVKNTGVSYFNVYVGTIATITDIIIDSYGNIKFELNIKVQNGDDYTRWEEREIVPLRLDKLKRILNKKDA